MLLTTAMSFGNQWLGNGNFDGKVLVAGAIATGGLVLMEKIPGIGALAPGIAWISFITLMFTRLGGKPSPVDNIKKLTGL